MLLNGSGIRDLHGRDLARRENAKREVGMVPGAEANCALDRCQGEGGADLASRHLNDARFGEENRSGFQLAVASVAFDASRGRDNLPRCGEGHGEGGCVRTGGRCGRLSLSKASRFDRLHNKYP